MEKKRKNQKFSIDRNFLLCILGEFYALAH